MSDELQNKEIYLGKNVILRKEFFGGLVLMRNGKRYKISPNVYSTLTTYLGKKIDRAQLGEYYYNIFMNLLKLGIISTFKSNGKLVENKNLGDKTLSYPKIVYFEITNQCNLNCVHCYAKANERPKEILSLTTIKKLIDNLSQHGAEFLSIGGGEPFLRNDLIDIVRYAIQKDVEVEISTNGHLINDQKIKSLKDAGLRFIQVSLDAGNAETYRKIRGGKFERVLKAIHSLSKEFIVTVSSVLTQLNYLELEQMIDVSATYGADYFRVVKLMEIGRGEQNKKLLELKADQVKSVLKKMQQLHKERADIKIEVDENFIIPSRKAIDWLPTGVYGCSAGRSTCLIDYQGYVYPCTFLSFPEFRAGNIKSQDLNEIWETSSILNKFRNIDHLEGKCSSCRYLYTCLGGCRAEAYYQTGNIYGEVSDCFKYQKA